MGHHRALFRWALIALIAALAVALQWSHHAGSALSGAENLIKDPLRRALASGDAETRLVVVDLDEASIAALGPWPWPRSRIADLIEALAGPYQARLVGLDIVFPSPADAAGDERLAALSDFAPVVLAQALDFVPRSPALVSGTPVFGAPPVPGIATAKGAPATGYMANHAGMSKARCVGNIGLQPDEDGRIRSVPLLAQWQDRASPLLPLAMLACPLQRGTSPRLEGLSAFGGDATRWELPFARDWSAYTVIPASAILDASAPADLVRGRWVLIGSSALGLNDRAATPLAAAAAGVMVHAAAMTSLLDRLEGKSPAGWDGRWLASLWTVLTLAAAAWALGRFKAWWLVPGLVVVVGAWLGAAAWLMSRNAQFSASTPLLAYALVLLVISVELWMTQREQGQILRSFATYVAPSVLDQMLRLGLNNPMHPQHREITVISADMQDYTGLTNKSTLHEAAQLTREFLQCLTEPILSQGGTLDKYTGDGLVAFWGAPLASPDHTEKALKAACTMIANVREWNTARMKRGLPPARVRVGVESGSVLVGDLGTVFRRTYTAVGDCINTASKLQAVAKTLSCDLVVGPVAARLARESELVPVVSVQLPGHNEVSVLWSFPSLSSSLPQAEAARAAAGQPV